MQWVGMYGFNNTYGLVVRREIAEKYNIKTYSDLKAISNQMCIRDRKSVQNERVAINEIGVKGFRGCFTGKQFLENDRRTIFQK